MAKCSICGGKAGFLSSFDLKDGRCCIKCSNRFDKAGIIFPNYMDYGDFTAQEAKCFLDDPVKWNAIAKERRERREKTSEKCLICGKPFTLTTGPYMTSDGYALCVNCMLAAITISPQEFLQGDEKYIKAHDSQFFKENMGHLEQPHAALAVNFSKQRFYYRGEIHTKVDSVFSFASVIKFETDTQTYEVTVGKKGHPIARAVAGGALFGGTGAVVGAMTAKNTRHKETREGQKYISIYHRDSINPDTIRKRTCYCNSDEEVAKLEECLKRVFEYREDEQKKLEESNKDSASVEPANNYGKLIELKKLLDMGVITQEEFDTKKKQILGL